MSLEDELSNAEWETLQSGFVDANRREFEDEFDAPIIAAFEQILAGRLAAERENPRDEHHTMSELYEYRMLYNALLFNTWRWYYPTGTVVKSWKHSDGELCFGGGWFIVVAETWAGQISNHYKAEHWGIFQIPEVDTPPTYDGHTPADVAKRMHALLRRTL